ncbi:GNAT family N-acetyltransferase [Nonomuraea polychroma]|uniref:GNAT family N-acetyltransferase n=1 Tax=Nonomuraea polychroma TaxID=46176 RepID=UPI003D90B1DE
MQQRLTRALAELELLAVAEPCRGAGIGTLLLTAAEELLAAGGCELMFAKVRLTTRRVLLWYRRRRFLVAVPREPVAVEAGRAMVSFDDGGDGYQLVVKSLLPGTRVSRVNTGAGTCLVVRHERPSTPSTSSASLP